MSRGIRKIFKKTQKNAPVRTEPERLTNTFRIGVPSDTDGYLRRDGQTCGKVTRGRCRSSSDCLLGMETAMKIVNVRKIPDGNSVCLGTRHFTFHPGGNTSAEHPDLRATDEQALADAKSRLAFFGKRIVQKLGKVQVRRDGKIPLLHCRTAVFSCAERIGLCVARIRGTNIDHVISHLPPPAFRAVRRLRKG